MFVDEIWEAINRRQDAKSFWSKYLDVEERMLSEVMNFITGPVYFDPYPQGRDLQIMRDLYFTFVREALFFLRLRVPEKHENRDKVLGNLDFLLSKGPDEIHDYVERMIRFIKEDDQH